MAMTMTMMMNGLCCSSSVLFCFFIFTRITSKFMQFFFSAVWLKFAQGICSDIRKARGVSPALLTYEWVPIVWGWALKPLSQVAAVPAQVDCRLCACMHACVCAAYLSPLCHTFVYFTLCLSTTHRGCRMALLHRVTKWALLCKTKACTFHRRLTACRKSLWTRLWV